MMGTFAPLPLRRSATMVSHILLVVTVLAATVLAQGSPVPSPTEPTVFCNICPNGAQAMGTGSIGGSSCQDLDLQGRNSEFTFLQCLDVQNGAARGDDPCGCGLVGPTNRTFKIERRICVPPSLICVAVGSVFGCFSSFVCVCLCTGNCSLFPCRFSHFSSRHTELSSLHDMPTNLHCTFEITKSNRPHCRSNKSSNSRPHTCPDGEAIPLSYLWVRGNNNGTYQSSVHGGRYPSHMRTG
jgi:hypothetical protein